MRILPFERPSSEIPRWNELLPGDYTQTIQTGGVLKEATLGLAHPFWLISSTHLSEEAAYLVVKTMWENSEKLQKVHALLGQFSPKTMLGKISVLPYHPGAVRLYKEKGAWNEELEKMQKALPKAR